MKFHSEIALNCNYFIVVVAFCLIGSLRTACFMQAYIIFGRLCVLPAIWCVFGVSTLILG